MGGTFWCMDDLNMVRAARVPLRKTFQCKPLSAAAGAGHDRKNFRFIEIGAASEMAALSVRVRIVALGASVEKICVRATREQGVRSLVQRMMTPYCLAVRGPPFELAAALRGTACGAVIMVGMGDARYTAWVVGRGEAPPRVAGCHACSRW